MIDNRAMVCDVCGDRIEGRHDLTVYGVADRAGWDWGCLRTRRKYEKAKTEHFCQNCKHLHKKPLQASGYDPILMGA